MYLPCRKVALRDAAQRAHSIGPRVFQSLSVKAQTYHGHINVIRKFRRCLQLSAIQWHLSPPLSIYTVVSLSLCVCVCMFVCVRVRVRVCVCVCVCVCVRAHVLVW